MDRRKLRYRGLTVALLLFALGLLPAMSAGAQGNRPAPPEPWTGPAPQAECGPNDRPETGLQGQTTREERESGASEEAYNCNLELVGQYQGEGGRWQMDWFNDCAYFGQNFNDDVQDPGVVVVDASDPSNPRATARLDSAAMLDPHESLKVNQKRRLLAGWLRAGPFFDTYDVSGDCTQPELLASVEFPDTRGHAGDFAPDGLTWYNSAQPNLTMVDLTDPTDPQELGRTTDLVHDLSISKDGTRAYLAQPGLAFGRSSPNGLVIADVSDFQFRRPNPEVRPISSLFWEEGGQAQQTIPVTYRGKPHLIFTDEVGYAPTARGIEGWLIACDKGLPPYGYTRIIDISDERDPAIISEVMLEVNDPELACAHTLDDWAPEIATREFYGYASHYCGVDRPNNPTLLGCSHMNAGLRVFDIRDPYQPKEIAYYKPPAQRTAFLPGSAIWLDYDGLDRQTDRATTQVRFNKYRGETHVWFVSQDNGFQIVRFTNDVLKGPEKGKDFKKGKRYGKDYRKSYGKDYRRSYGKDYRKSYGKDYRKGKGYGKGKGPRGPRW